AASYSHPVRSRRRWSLVVAVGLAAATVTVAGTVRGAGAARRSCAPRWAVVANSPATPTLFGVVALSPEDVWAVGYEGPLKKAVPVIAHWDGRRLRRFRAFRPSPKGGSMSAIAAVAPDDIWAVGADGTGHAVAMHWDGTAWAVVPTPR